MRYIHLNFKNMDLMESSFIGIFILIILALLSVYIFFLITLQRTLETIDISRRTKEPGHVWFMLIPLFNMVWQFIMVNHITDSIRNECNRLNIPVQEARPAYGIGITMCALSVCGLIPVIGYLASFAGIIAMIIYWRKVNTYKNLIIANRDNFLLDAEREAMQSRG